MKSLYLLAPLGIALAGCSINTRPVAVEHVYTPPPAVAVTPPAAVVTPPSAVVMGAPAIADSDGDGHADTVDRYPNDALRY